MSDEFHSPDRTWRQKFRDAFRGVAFGIHDQSSFHVHFLVAAAVLTAAGFLRFNRLEWCLLILCIGGVLVSEMFNTALEHLAKAVDRSHNPHIGNALDIGSAAVLLAAFSAAIAGGILIGAHLVQRFNPLSATPW
jgi:diacylglycerol kinase